MIAQQPMVSLFDYLFDLSLSLSVSLFFFVLVEQHPDSQGEAQSDACSRRTLEKVLPAMRLLAAGESLITITRRSLVRGPGSDANAAQSVKQTTCAPDVKTSHETPFGKNRRLFKWEHCSRK